MIGGRDGRAFLDPGSRLPEMLIPSRQPAQIKHIATLRRHDLRHQSCRALPPSHQPLHPPRDASSPRAASLTRRRNSAPALQSQILKSARPPPSPSQQRVSRIVSRVSRPKSHALHSRLDHPKPPQIRKASRAAFRPLRLVACESDASPSRAPDASLVSYTDCLTAPRLVCLYAPLALLSNMLRAARSWSEVRSLHSGLPHHPSPQRGSCDPAKRRQPGHTAMPPCDWRRRGRRTAAVDRLSFRHPVSTSAYRLCPSAKPSSSVLWRRGCPSTVASPRSTPKRLAPGHACLPFG